MKILISGKTGVGKTAILNKLNFENTLYVDTLVKEVFYKEGHSVFELVVKKYGQDIVNNKQINTKLLGAKVLIKRSELKKLSIIVNPFIKDYILGLKGDWLIEMASYINYENYFKECFDKVVLIKRDKKLVENKFNYIKTKKISLIKNRRINYDLLIENNSDLNDATETFKIILQNTYLKNI